MANLQDIIPAFFTGAKGERLTPEQIAQRQVIAQSLMEKASDTRPDAGGIASILTKGLQGYQAGRNNRSADIATQTNAAASEANMTSMLGALTGSGAAYPAAVAGGVSPTSGVATGTVAPSGATNSFLSAIDRTEGGGSYDTLFGHAQRQGGQFAGVKISEMPISEVLAFANPSGQYGQSVKGKVGRVATPMGRYQIVGSTLKGAVKEMGLDPSTPFTPQVQDAVAMHIAQKAIAGKDDQAAMSALRNTWEGFRSVPSSQMASILGDIRKGLPPQQAQPQAQPVQVASADPNFMPQQAGGEALFAPGSDVSPTDIAFASQGGVPAQSDYVDPVVAPNPSEIPQQQPIAGNNSAPGAIYTGPDGQLYQNIEQLDGSFAPSRVIADEYTMARAQNNVTPQVAQQLAQPQMQAQQQAQTQPQGGINPAVIQALSSPYSSPQEKQIAGLLLNKQMADQSQQQAQAQQIAQRQQTASAFGISPEFIGVDDAGWKAKIDQQTRNRNTVTIGNTVYDANTGQPVIEGSASPTADIQNYEYARGNGYGGTFADYQQEVKRAGATNISNVLGDGMPGLGRLSTDYTYVMGQDGKPILDEKGLPKAVPVPGSSADVALQKEKDAADRQKILTERQLNPTIDDIATARDLATKTGTLGQMAPILKNIPVIGQNAENMAATIDAIGSGISLENLNQMRQASPTGGALGNVSDKQSALLSEAFGSLRQSMSKDLFLYNLARVENVLNDIVHGNGLGPDRNDLGALRGELGLGNNQVKQESGKGQRTSTGVTWSID